MSVQRIRSAFLETSRNYATLAEMSEQVAAAADLIIGRMRQGGKVIFCGNGGSAADAQHLAAELLGRFLKDRRPLAALAVTTNSSTMTAIGNDYSYDDIFERQVRGLGRPEDVLVGLSTSGNSGNVVSALEAARAIGMATIGLTGAKDGKMDALCDLCLKVPSTSTPRIQEMHIGVGHMLCELVEDALT